MKRQEIEIKVSNNFYLPKQDTKIKCADCVNKSKKKEKTCGISGRSFNSERTDLRDGACGPEGGFFMALESQIQDDFIAPG